MTDEAEWIERLTRIFDEPIFVVDTLGTIFAANVAAARLCRRPSTQLRGKPLASLLVDVPEKVSDYLRLCARSIETVPTRLSWKLPDNQITQMRCDGAVLEPPSAGNPARVLVRCRPQQQAIQQFTLLNQKIAHLTREIRERKRAEEQLAQLNERLEQLVSERSALAEHRTAQLQRLASELSRVEQRERQRLAQLLHDHLQQIVVAAMMKASMLLRQPDPAEHYPGLRRIEELLTEAIETSRSLAVELSPPVLHDAGLRAAMQWLVRWMEQHHTLRTSLEWSEEVPEPEDEGTRTFVFHAVKELLLNVVKHAGTSEAALSFFVAEDDRLRAIVSDRGRGFSHRPGDQSASDGFGLFSIRERLEVLGGDLQVESQPGEGSRISLLVPLKTRDVARQESEEGAFASATAGVADSPREPAEQGNHRIRVLVVDDHRIVRQGLVGMLGEDPSVLVVGEAGDGEEAVQMAHQLVPDVIVMDINMPKLNGIEATRRIKRDLPHIGIIALSLHQEEDMAAKMMEAGATRYISKDGPLERLLSTILELRRAS